MTNTHDDPSQPAPADDPALHVAGYRAAFNSGDLAALDRTYEDRGVLVPRPGHPVSGDGRTAATAHLLSLGLPIEATTRHAYVADDIALLIVDWSIRGTAPDGREVGLAGTAADVARRGPDGHWRYVIDNPFGTA
ncbi:YybH family protein [Nocardiopsis mangrovi]|uniref:YybH family protein n=1 Tax=Nocardiopsis mangrovi TaxID=1179818 RepID=A0ABV9E3M8_9ACTN